jgi:hypothetical protein
LSLETENTIQTNKHKDIEVLPEACPRDARSDVLIESKLREKMFQPTAQKSSKSSVSFLLPAKSELKSSKKLHIGSFVLSVPELSGALGGVSQ